MYRVEKYSILLKRYLIRYIEPLVRYFIKAKLFCVDVENNPPLIVLTMGKVGSTSVYKSLKKRLKNPVFHLHYLSDKGLEKAVEMRLSSKLKSYSYHLILSEELKKTGCDLSKLKYITIIREPISRQLSSFFQNVGKLGSDLEGKDLRVDYENALEYLMSTMSFSDEAERVWFNREVRDIIGIDVYGEEFDIIKGYEVYRSNSGGRLLLMRMEDMDKVFCDAIYKFLGQQKVLLRRYNEGSAKIYNKAYERLKKNVKFSAKEIDMLINTIFFTKFYIDYKKMLKDKWLLK